MGGPFGLTVSIPKTNGLAMGSVLSEGNISSVEVKGGVIEMVKDFTYLGSNFSADGEITCEVNCRIVRASKSFDSLRTSVFSNYTLSIHTKRTVYNVVIVSILLYGAKTWTLNALDVHRLTVFTIIVSGSIKIPAVE